MDYFLWLLYWHFVTAECVLYAGELFIFKEITANIQDF